MAIIHIKKRENPYTQIDKRCLEDCRLSWRARGILAYLLSKPDNWQVSVKDIQLGGKEGREAVQAAMKELEKIGYARLESDRGQDGRVLGKRWVICEEPINWFSVRRMPTDERVSRRTVSPTVGKHDTNNNKGNNNETEEEAAATEKKSSPLKAEKENPTPHIPAAPPSPAPGATFGAVDPAAEAERMRGNQSLRDTFSMTRRIPADRFDAYLSEFVREVSATEEAHYGTRAFRSHFLNWSEKRYRIAKDQAATTTTATRSTIPQAIRVYE